MSMYWVWSAAVSLEFMSYYGSDIRTGNMVTLETLELINKKRIILIFCTYSLNINVMEAAAVAQSVRAFVPQAECWAFESQPQQC